MSEFEDAFRSGQPPLLPPTPPQPETSGNRSRLLLKALGALNGVLLIILIAVAATGGSGPGLAVAASTTVSPSTSEPATPSSNPTTTITSTTAATPTTAAATTTTVTTTTSVTTTTMVVLPSFVIEDCVGYDLATLEIEDLGADGWILTAGPSGDLLLFDTETDALLGLAIAGNHTNLCFIGRGNAQSDPSRYIHNFWYGDSGVRVPIPGPEDCLGHDPMGLYIENTNGDVWRLMDAGQPMSSFDGEADALAGLALGQAFSEHCYIGRDNERPDRRLYITEYWK